MEIPWQSPERHQAFGRLSRLVLWSAILVSLPAIVLIVLSGSTSSWLTLDRWAPLTLLLGVIYLAQALYLRSLPDPAAARSVSLWSLLLAGGSSAALALCLYGPPQHPILVWLDAVDEVLQGSAALGCLAILLLSSWIAVRAGQLGFRR